jgi:hypothetical protein
MNRKCIHENPKDMCDICKPAPTPTQPSERAMKCAEAARDEFAPLSQDFPIEQLAAIIDRHTDSMAEELAEALRPLATKGTAWLEDRDFVAGRLALAKFDAMKGKR